MVKEYLSAESAYMLGELYRQSKLEKVMKKFLFIEYQNGGCDYTIGCGVRVNRLIEAETAEEARLKFIHQVEKDYRDENDILSSSPWSGDYSPDDVEMYEVAEVCDFNFESVREHAQDEVNIYERLKKEAAERAEFARLQEKYGE